VPIYGSAGVGQPGTDGQEMVVIDIPSRTVTGKVDFGHGVRPHCPVYDRASGMVYVTTELDQTVTIVDPKTLKIVGTVPTGQKESHMLVISRDGKRGYTSNVGAGSVSVLDLPGRKTVAIIPISSQAQRIAISNDDKMVFTSDQTKPQLAVIDTATNKIKTWIALPAIGYGAAATIDGRWLLVATSGAFHPPANGTPPPQGIDPAKSSVAVIDLASLKVVRAIPMPGGPQEILVSPDGKSAYVSCFVKIRDTTAAAPDRAVEKEIGQIAVIDLANWKMKSLIDTGQGADGLAWAAAQ
jgi:DNA-binding beta-propeller fold protein YncE